MHFKPTEKPAGVNRFVTLIEKPIIERKTDNLNKDTFDFIKVSINLMKTLEEDERQRLAKEYYEEIKDMVVDKIEKYKPFIKYGVPINVLELSDVRLTKDACMLFIFEVKGTFIKDEIGD